MFASHEGKLRFLEWQKNRPPMINVLVRFQHSEDRWDNLRADQITKAMVERIDPADLQKFQTWQSLEGQRGRTS